MQRPRMLFISHWDHLRFLVLKEWLPACVIEVLSEEYLYPFSVSLDENLYNLSSGVPVEDQLENEILCNEQ